MDRTVDTIPRRELPIDTQNRNKELVGAWHDESIGWLTVYTERRFMRGQTTYEVYCYYPELDLHYCPEVNPDKPSLVKEWHFPTGESCLWLTTSELNDYGLRALDFMATAA